MAVVQTREMPELCST